MSAPGGREGGREPAEGSEALPAEPEDNVTRLDFGKEEAEPQASPEPEVEPEPDGPSLEARLTIDLAAIVANWRALDARSAPEVETAAVLKADAYGLGAAEIAPALAAAGARTFFVALPREGVALRRVLDQAGAGDATIYILGGYFEGDRRAFEDAMLRPVLNSLEQGEAWFRRGPGGAAAIQLDTGMNRLGMEAPEIAALGPLPEPVGLVMSHLACADTPGHDMNAGQRTAFASMAAALPDAGPALPRSLAATGGTLMGGAYHFDLTRPGIGLFGGLPFRDARPVVRLEAPIIQIREVATGEAVGYGASFRARRPTRIATISTGYADGLLRAAGGRAQAALAGRLLPFAGRVSMDVITLDVTHCPEAAAGAMVELIGPTMPLDTLAEAAGTIGYEILTSLGPRYRRRYLPA
ncbi:MAG: alanine racemase [Pseudomonadota bacterium]